MGWSVCSLAKNDAPQLPPDAAERGGPVDMSAQPVRYSLGERPVAKVRELCAVLCGPCCYVPVCGAVDAIQNVAESGIELAHRQGMNEAICYCLTAS